MSVDNYDDILNATWDDIPVEHVLPTGGWLLRGDNAAFIRPKEEGKKAKVLFTYKAVQPTETVRAEDLEELPEGYDLSINNLQHQVFIESAADWDNVRKHLAKHGITLTGNLFDERGKLAFNKAFRGSEIVANLDQDNYQNDAGETIWKNKLNNFQRAE